MSRAWKDFEREKVRELKSMGFNAVRNWSSQFERHDTVDIEAKPFMLQLKYGLRPNPKNALDQAREGVKKGEIPIGVARYKTEKDTIVCLGWKDFTRLISLWKAVGAQ